MRRRAMLLAFLTVLGYQIYATTVTQSNGGAVQRQLAYVPIPEPASLMLLGTGLMVASRRFRRRKDR